MRLIINIYLLLKMEKNFHFEEMIYSFCVKCFTFSWPSVFRFTISKYANLLRRLLVYRDFLKTKQYGMKIAYISYKYIYIQNFN